MSASSGLSTLLVQRIDAMLGHAAASHPTLIGGVRADAVAAPGAPARLLAPEDATQPGVRQPAAEPAAQTVPLTRGTPSQPSGANAQAASSAPPPDSAQIRLGQTARLISALLSEPALDHRSVRGAAPLLAPDAADAPAAMRVAIVASQLRRALQTSGLFYETRLSEWVQGRATLADLHAQPQASWPSEARPSTSARMGSASPEIAAMLRMQLEALAAQSFSWQGTAWDDVAVGWRLRRDRESGESEQESLPTWRSQLTLALPRLGQVVAQASLRGSLLTIELQADQSEPLRARLDVLRHRLQAAGLADPVLTVATVPGKSEAT